MIRSLVCVLIASAPAFAEDIKLVGISKLPGTSTDRSGLTDTLEDGSPHNRLGGHGSAIAYTGEGNRYILVSDRGPKDGAVSFRDRMHLFDIEVRLGESMPMRLLETTMLTDQNGKPYHGSLQATPDANSAGRFDPEGARMGATGTVFICDEYGPSLKEFTRDGREIRSIPLPKRYLTAKPGATPADELPPHTTSGRQPNRGMESLAISPDGSTLFLLMQGPLIQDGGLDAMNNRVGRNLRLLTVDVKTGKPGAEYVYRLDAPDLGTNEILAINNKEFLVIERDGKAGVEAKVKKIMRIDLTGATDVSGIETLPGGDLPKTVQPVAKTLFLDLLDSNVGIPKASVPEKFEGLAFGPDLPDGRRLLLVTSDNDFVPEADFQVFAFAIERRVLPGFEPQRFGSASTNTTSIPLAK